MLVFEGRDIKVVACMFEGCRDTVITFTGRAAEPPVAKGFGETYLMKRGVSAVHFISKDNHWWQTPEPIEAIRTLRESGLLDGDRRITLYGSSMGGYAALIYSRALRPHQVVVFSPQYSINPKRVPFEQRWRAYAARLSFDHDDMAAGISPDTEIKAVFDPFFLPDARHVDMIESHRPVERIAISFAGHNTARMMQEVGLITEVTDKLILGGFDRANFTRRCRATRGASSLFWYGLAEALHRHVRAAAAGMASAVAAAMVVGSDRMRDRTLRLDILNRAIWDACAFETPHHAAVWLAEVERLDGGGHRTAYARALVAQAKKDYATAVSQARAGVAMSANETAYVALDIEATLQAEGPQAALARCDCAPNRLKKTAPFLLARARAQAADGQWEQARDTLVALCRLERRNPAARALLARAWSQLGRPDAAGVQLAPVLPYPVASPRLAAEIVALLEQGGLPERAETFRARNARFRDGYAALIGEIFLADWTDPAAAVSAVRARVRAATARSGEPARPRVCVVPGLAS